MKEIFDTTLRIELLKKEIEYAKTCLRPTATGHIHTAINWLEHRVKELQKEEHL